MDQKVNVFEIEVPDEALENPVVNEKLRQLIAAVATHERSKIAAPTPAAIQVTEASKQEWPRAFANWINGQPKGPLVRNLLELIQERGTVSVEETKKELNIEGKKLGSMVRNFSRWSRHYFGYVPFEFVKGGYRWTGFRKK